MHLELNIYSGPGLGSYDMDPPPTPLPLPLECSTGDIKKGRRKSENLLTGEREGRSHAKHKKARNPGPPLIKTRKNEYCIYLFHVKNPRNLEENQYNNFTD